MIRAVRMVKYFIPVHDLGDYKNYIILCPVIINVLRTTDIKILVIRIQFF